MPEFAIGNKVRCIDNSDTLMEQGAEYTVTGSSPGYVEIDGRRGGWFNWRFELVNDTPIPVPVSGEADPNGIGQNQPGAKLDAGKLLPALVLGEFARALEAVAEVGTVGARKYTPRGWLSVPNGEERYREAAMRHQLEVWKGNPVDNGPGGTGKLHKAQVLWNLLAELELELRRAEQT